MNILLFGITRDIVGNTTFALPDSDLGQLQTVGDLKKYLGHTYPELLKLESLAVAVNQQYATDEAPIADSDEIALIPPVSGG